VTAYRSCREVTAHPLIDRVGGSGAACRLRRNGNPIDQRMGGPSPSPLDVSPGRPNST
jgi:hypothetical protein